MRPRTSFKTLFPNAPFSAFSISNGGFETCPSVRHALLVLTLVAISFSSAKNLYAEVADWPSWRGAQSTGSTEHGDYPKSLDPKDALWVAPLPGKGCSTPIIWNKKVFLTAPQGGNDAVLAINWSGKQLWQTSFGAEIAGKHRNGSGSNASPVTDGEGVFVYFKSGTLAALEMNGNIRWQTNLVERFGPAKLFWDHGTSPVLTKEHVVFTRMHDGDSWLAAFDKQTGELAWKVARNYPVKTENDQCYTTPILIDFHGEQGLLVWGSEHLTVHSAEDGSVLWSCTNFNPGQQKLWPAIAMPVIVDDMVVVAYGRNDKKKPLLYGIRLDGKGDVTKTNHIWKRTDISTFVPSPISYRDRVFLVRDRGEIECIDPTTGENHWTAKLPKNRAAYYASPLIAADFVYAPREDGVVFVGEIMDDGFRLLSENDMGEPVIGSPVPGMNRIFIRGEEHLFCFGDK